MSSCLAAASCGGGGGSAPVQPPPPIPISVTATPANAVVVLGATQQFTASVTGTSNSAVTWAVNGVPGGNAQVGTVSAAGLFTAPQNLPTPSSVNIIATSVADSTRSATVSAAIQSDLVITISPDPANVELGASRNFTATVASAGNPNRAVAWAVNGVPGGNATVGTIAANGDYAAPPNLPSPAAVTISATSIADPSKSDAAVVNLTSTFVLSINGPASADTGTSVTYTATVAPIAGSNPNPAVTWSVNGAVNGSPTVGLICLPAIAACNAPAAAFAGPVEFRAPLVAPATPQVMLTATSAADPSKSATVLITIHAVVVVSITPAPPVSAVLGGSIVFNATVGGTLDQRVEWDVNGIVGGDQNTIGAIHNPVSLVGPATYFAPAQLPGGANTVLVRATSRFDPAKSASVSVQLFSNIVLVAHTSSGATESLRAVNRKEILCAGIANATNPALQWTINGVPNGNATVGTLAPIAAPLCPASGSPPGSLVTAMEYSAPASAPVPSDVLAVATSVADPSRSASIRITILLAPVVTVSPASVTLQTGSAVQFTANVQGTPVMGVAWDVNGVPNGDTASGEICVVASNPCAAPPSPFAGPVEYRSPASVPANPQVAITATGADGGAATSTVTVTAAPANPVPQITRMLPSSITAGVASPFLLKVIGVNFVAGSGSGASVIFFGSPPAAKTTNCAVISGVQECTATVDAAEVAAPGNFSVQVRNPDTTLSSAATFIAAAESAGEDSIQLISAAPSATGKDIVVVEPLTAGSGAQTLNINVIGVIVNNACSAQATPVVIRRHPTNSINVDLCLGGTGLASSNAFTLTGPGDITLGVPTGIALGFVQVRLPLTIPSNAQTGARTLFASNSNKEKSAASGVIDIQ